MVGFALKCTPHDCVFRRIVRNPARKLLVVGAQSLSVLTVASYVQDQFRHQASALVIVWECQRATAAWLF